MRRYRFVQFDVFTDVAFGGNQLAVFTSASGLSDSEMQQIAAEMNYAETTFVLPPRENSATAAVRIFTPRTELPFAGHPVIGTTFALAHEGALSTSAATPAQLELAVGTLAVDLLFEEERLSFAWMHQPLPTYTPWTGDEQRLLAALGLSAADRAADLPVEYGSAGVRFLYLPLRSVEALSRARSSAELADTLGDPAALRQVYPFALEGSDQVRSRMFAPDMGIAEDAATGSAAGPLGGYLLRHRRLQADAAGTARLRITQGVEMGRPSRLDVAIDVASDGTPRDVRVGGSSVLIAEGELLLP